VFSTRPTGECRVCGKTFEKLRPLQGVCGLQCAKKRSAQIKKELKEQVKADRAEVVKRKEKLKPKSYWLKLAQTAFNKFIRVRDSGLLCISSAVRLVLECVGGGFDCGHFRSVGSAPHLRFNEDNAHGQSKHDNRYLSGNASEYRKGLIVRIGLERVEALESNNEAVKYSVDDLKAIATLYRAKAKDLLALRES